jgi:hypothetical protein
MAHKKGTKKIKVRDLQPRKDAKGGFISPQGGPVKKKPLSSSRPLSSSSVTSSHSGAAVS